MKKGRGNSVILLAFFLGIIMMIQIKSFNPANTFVTLKSIKEMEAQLEVDRVEAENLTRLIKEKKFEISKYENAIEDTGTASDIIEDELGKKKAEVGLMDLRGPGIKVVLKDSEREVKEGQNPNDVVIHDQDVLTVLNDLKVAGAEAIAINGERIISSSEIKCAGPTITINGRTYGTPFIITAIGDPKTLEASIVSTDSYANLIKQLYGIGVEVKVQQNILINAYSDKLQLKYMKEGD